MLCLRYVEIRGIMATLDELFKRLGGEQPTEPVALSPEAKQKLLDMLAETTYTIEPPCKSFIIEPQDPSDN